MQLLILKSVASNFHWTLDCWCKLLIYSVNMSLLHFIRLQIRILFLILWCHSASQRHDICTWLRDCRLQAELTAMPAVTFNFLTLASYSVFYLFWHRSLHKPSCIKRSHDVANGLFKSKETSIKCMKDTIHN